MYPISDQIKSQLKQYLEQYVEQITTPSGNKRNHQYVCPFCESGTGKNKTGAFSLDPKSGCTRWHCFACGEAGDIFDLVGKVEKLSNHGEQIKKVADMFGVSLEQSNALFHSVKGGSSSKEKETAPKAYHAEFMPSPEFFDKATESLNSFLKGKTKYRGITLETLDRFKVGFIANWTHPNSSGTYSSPRVIVPTSETSYLARDTRPHSDATAKWEKQKVGASVPFNVERLRDARTPIFIVEGEFDALSVIDVNGVAIALGSTSNENLFLKQVAKYPPEQPIVLALDHDTSGEQASQKLKVALEAQGVAVMEYPQLAGVKDPNEGLQKDRDAFSLWVREGERLAQEQQAAAKADARSEYDKISAGYSLPSFLGDLDAIDTEYIPSGFLALDSVLEGGLYAGLYVIGAISSLGKTTYVTQIADQVARNGNSVLFFSIEMDRSEIIAKSLCRESALYLRDTGGEPSEGLTIRQITSRQYRDFYTETQRQLLGNAVERYGKYAGNIYIKEGLRGIGVEQIREGVKQHIAVTGARPLVIVDYLQILTPNEEGRYTDKQIIDKAVLELKCISRDFKVPVIAVSSFNRSAYSNSVNMEAFKESGAIEYSSDVLLGLQLEGAGGENFNVNKAKGQSTRKIELVILKNRNGRTGGKIKYQYLPAHHVLEEQDGVTYNY